MFMRKFELKRFMCVRRFKINELRHEISNNMYVVLGQQRLRPACAYVQTDQTICYLLEYSINVKLLTEQHFEFLSLKEGCACSSESTLVKIPHCWKSRMVAQIVLSSCSLLCITAQIVLSSCSI